MSTLDVTYNKQHNGCMSADDETPGRFKYKDKQIQQFAEGKRVREFQAFEKQAYKQLEILESAPNKETFMR